MNTNALVGLTLKEAKKLAKNNNMKFRITARDGRMFILTDDFLTNRINVEVENGKITQAGIG